MNIDETKEMNTSFRKIKDGAVVLKMMKTKLLKMLTHLGTQALFFIAGVNDIFKKTSNIMLNMANKVCTCLSSHVLLLSSSLYFFFQKKKNNKDEK